MDGNRFDAWTRAMRSRRQAVRGLAAGAGLAGLAAVAGLRAPAPALAERCPGRKKKCGKDCIRRTQCCTDGDCPADANCTSQHRCQCPAGTSKCGDRCAGFEGAPCAGQPLEFCCSGACDFLVGGGTCASCLGWFCSSDADCCPGVTCGGNRCGNCLHRAVACTPGQQACCASECSTISGFSSCLSRAGGRCENNPDCATCYYNSANCAGICSGGVCQR